MTGRCLRCLAQGPVHGHHVTLRDAVRRYLHPDLTAPLCDECHQGLHRLLQKAGVERVELVTPDIVVARISIFRTWMDWPWLGRTTPTAALPVAVAEGIERVLEEATRERLGLAA